MCEVRERVCEGVCMSVYGRGGVFVRERMWVCGRECVCVSARQCVCLCLSVCEGVSSWVRECECVSVWPCESDCVSPGGPPVCPSATGEQSGEWEKAAASRRALPSPPGALTGEEPLAEAAPPPTGALWRRGRECRGRGGRGRGVEGRGRAGRGSAQS